MRTRHYLEAKPLVSGAGWPEADYRSAGSAFDSPPIGCVMMITRYFKCCKPALHSPLVGSACSGHQRQADATASIKLRLSLHQVDVQSTEPVYTHLQWQLSLDSVPTNLLLPLAAQSASPQLSTAPCNQPSGIQSAMSKTARIVAHAGACWRPIAAN